MKIKDVIISEAPATTKQPVAGTGMAGNNTTTFANAYALRNAPGGPPPFQTTQPGTGMAGNQGAQVKTKTYGGQQKKAPKKAPKKAATPGTVPQDTLPTDAQTATSSYTGQAQTTPAPATDPAMDPYDPAKDPSLAAGNAALAQPAPAQNPDLDRLKQLAIGQNTLNQQASQQGQAMAQAAKTPAPNTNPLGVAQTANVANALQPAPQADKPASAPAPAPAALPPGLASATTAQGSSAPTGQAAQANPDGTGIGANAQVNPDTGASTVAPPVKSGTGSTIKTGTGGTLGSTSDDEFAWMNANPANRLNRSAYPGPGKWDPKTGRTKTDPNAPGFFDRLFGKKQPAQGQAAQPAPAPGSMGTLTQDQIATINQNFGPKKEDINLLRKLAGLK
jgi:hypothetical protein